MNGSSEAVERSGKPGTSSCEGVWVDLREQLRSKP